MSRDSRARTRARRCAHLRASSAWIWRASPARGFKGRITHDDIKAFVKGALAGAPAAPAAAAPAAVPPQVPAVDFAQFGPVKTEPLSRIQRISGPRLHASWVNIPHVTQFDEADITELEQLRASLKQTRPRPRA